MRNGTLSTTTCVSPEGRCGLPRVCFHGLSAQVEPSGAPFFFFFLFFSGPQARDDFMLLNGYILNDYTCAYIMTFMLPVGLENLKYLLFGL